MYKEQELQKLLTRLEKVERELDKNRTSSYVDGWQTMRHAKKSRNWDLLAQEKIDLKIKIDELTGK